MSEASGSHGRRVVITADDAGLRRQWDDAIWEAHRSGVVTAVSVVTNGPTYPNACAYLRQAPGLDVGVHLNLIEGPSLGPFEGLASLLGERGTFPGSVHRFLILYLLRSLKPSRILLEWERQVQRAVEDGLRPVHLNSHYHVHLLAGGLFEMTVALARRFGIPFVRVVDEPPWLLFGPALRPVPLAKVTSLWLSSRFARRTLRFAGMERNVSTWGAGLSGALGTTEWIELARRLRQGATEIICHPGQSREQTAATASAALRLELERRAEIVRFRDLQGSHERR